MKTLAKWYPTILCVLGLIAVLTTFVVKCIAQEPVNKCNTKYIIIFTPQGANKPDTIVAYAYVPDTTCTAIVSK